MKDEGKTMALSSSSFILHPSSLPVPPGVVAVLLGVDLDVPAGRVHRGERLARLDHVMEELNQIRLLERAGLAERAAGELRAAAVVVGPEAGRPGGGELRQADVLTVGRLGR